MYLSTYSITFVLDNDHANLFKAELMNCFFRNWTCHFNSWFAPDIKLVMEHTPNLLLLIHCC